jgi:hypothetical protein
MESTSVRFCAAAFVTFLPLRVIHSVVIAADALTVPVFAIVGLVTLKLVRNPNRLLPWVALSLCLSLGVVCKYTFSGTIVATALVLGPAVWGRLGRAERLHWALVGGLCLVIPAKILELQYREIRAENNVMRHVWLRNGAPAVMRLRDLLLPKAADAAHFQAPRYFQDRIYETRRYSYPGLLHLATVTDCMDLFQAPPKGIRDHIGDPTWMPAVRERSAAAQALSVWSVRLSLGFSLLAVTGTLLCMCQAARAMGGGGWRTSEAAVVLAALAAGFYLPLVASLPRLNNPYLGAFWMPRLVLPSIIVFFIFGFALIDRLVRRLGAGGWSFAASAGICTYTCVVCGVFIALLA